MYKNKHDQTSENTKTCFKKILKGFSNRLNRLSKCSFLNKHIHELYLQRNQKATPIDVSLPTNAKSHAPAARYNDTKELIRPTQRCS